MDVFASKIEKISSHPTVWEFIKLAAIALATVAVVLIILKLERRIFKKIIADKKSINARFLEDIARVVIIIIAFQWVLMSSSLTQPFGRVLFQGTAIIGGIVALAAQPVISDLICGLMISSVKPFDIGDRIELEDGTAGIVKDITLRHVVIQTIDTCQVIIPNSKLNGMKITNMSFHTHIRSIHFRFHISYKADVEKAKAVIAKAVKSSPYTIAGKPNGDEKEYGPVYFIDSDDSSLILSTTAYFEPVRPSEVVKSDIHTRVKKALDEAGIEIPYSYMNVVIKEEKEKNQKNEAV